jgi:phosphoglycerate kinase
MHYKTILDSDLSNKNIILRADLNVPYKDGAVLDHTRIDRLKKTIEYLVNAKAKIIILSHFGRPKGRAVKEYSLSFLPPVLSSHWGHEVLFSEDCIGPGAEEMAASLKPGQILLMENTRFHEGEERNDSDFARQLSSLGDIFVNDAFSAAHRAHASTEGIAQFLPALAGLLMDEELKALSNALENPERPMAAIVGGAKISTKLELLDNLVEKADMLVLGGGMANTFLAAQEIDVKNSLCEHDMLPMAREIMDKATNLNCEIILPVDAITADKFDENSQASISDVLNIGDGQMMLDIGPQTIEMLKGKIQQCKTIIWNGPLGAFELKPFSHGTASLALHVGELTRQNTLISVAGGGDTIAALKFSGAADQFSYISTAGGAFLEWLEGKELPGVKALYCYQQAA